MRLVLAITLAAIPVVAVAAVPVPTAASKATTAYSVEDTDIGTLLDDPAARAILDKQIPGMTTSPQIEMARSFTLRQIQQYAADQVTDEVLAKIDADFKALGTK